MRLLLIFLLVSVLYATLAPPITSNDKKWIRSTAENDVCHKECNKVDGHVCSGLHKT